MSKNSQKGFANLIVIAIIALFFVIGGVSYLGLNKNQVLPSKSTSNNLKPNTILLQKNKTDGEKADITRIQDIDFLYVCLKEHYIANLAYPQSLGRLECPRSISLKLRDPVEKTFYDYVPDLNLKSFTLQAKLSSGEIYKGNPEIQKGIMTTIIKSDMRQLQVALGLYYEDNNAYPENLSLLIPNYIKTITKNPYSSNLPKYALENQKYTLITELPDGTNYTATP